MSIPFNRPYLVGRELHNIAQAHADGHLSGDGMFTRRCHAWLEQRIGARRALLTHSCTGALEMAAILMGLRPGDEVIMPSFTFVSTANAFVLRGAVPVFVDIRPDTLNIDETLIESAITPRTRAICVVHYAGVACEMDAIMDIARRHDLLVIDDAAHAIETVYKGKKIGNLGDITCFSFYVTKNIVTGEGGMVTTNKDVWADKIKMYGLHGMTKDAWKRYSDEGFKHYQVTFPGFKYNMMDIQASIGIHQMTRVDKYLARRNEIWKKYDESFAGLPLILPAPQDPNTVHARHLYTPLLDIDKVKITRDQFQHELYKRKIGTGIHFIALHLHDYYRKTFGYKPENFPNAKFISDRTISLPLSASLSDQDVQDVIDAVRDVLRDAGR